MEDCNIDKEINEYYEKLHSMPEIGFKEVKTTEYLLSEVLKLNPSDIERVPGGTGFAAIWIKDRNLPVVALHSDIDALSHNINGEEKCIHSCGHDANASCVLESIKLVLKDLKSLKVNPAVVFQPAEEIGKGAKYLIKNDIIKDIDVLIGCHIRPIQEVPFGYAVPAVYHGASATYAGKITGKTSHGARPHLGVNPIEVAAAMMNMINGIKVDPVVPHSIKFTKLVSGGASLNQIPGDAEFGIDVRAQKNDAMKFIEDKLFLMAKACENFYNAKIEIVKHSDCPAAEYDEELLGIAEKAIVKALGEKGLLKPIITPGGEDFHFFKRAYPDLKCIYLGVGADLTPGLHDPDMTFNRKALPNTVAILTEILKNYE